MKRFVLFCLLFAGVFACAHKQTKTEPIAPIPPPVAAPVVKAPAPVLAAAPVTMPVLADCNVVRVHFDFDKSVLFSGELADEHILLDKAADCIKAHSGVRFVLIGNADERGTQAYNLALGSRRAHAVAKYLESQGVGKKQLVLVSFGKARPLCTEHDEICWSMNRRAEIATIH